MHNSQYILSVSKYVRDVSKLALRLVSIFFLLRLRNWDILPPVGQCGRNFIDEEEIALISASPVHMGTVSPARR